MEKTIIERKKFDATEAIRSYSTSLSEDNFMGGGSDKLTQAAIMIGQGFMCRRGLITCFC